MRQRTSRKARAEPATYITDMTHFLTPQGAIAPEGGPARELAQSLGRIVAAASSRALTGCNQCGGEIMAAIGEDDAVVWECSGCKQGGVIRNWRGTLWDMSVAGTKQ